MLFDFAFCFFFLFLIALIFLSLFLHPPTLIRFFYSQGNIKHKKPYCIVDVFLIKFVIVVVTKMAFRQFFIIVISFPDLPG